MYLMRPLMTEWISSPMLGNRVWTLGIRSLQDLLCNLYVMKRPVSNSTQVNLFIWTRVHLERMLTAPVPLIPSNAPRVVLDILHEVDQILFSRMNLVAVYAPVFTTMTAMVTGPKAIVLETPKFRPQNQGIIVLVQMFPGFAEKAVSTTLLELLARGRRDLWAPLLRMMTTDALPHSHLMYEAEAFLSYLENKAIVDDKSHNWVEEIPWDQLVRMVLAAVQDNRSEVMGEQIKNLSTLLEVDF